MKSNMLAKVWKKALLAVCIIACLYNVMHKIVSRTSLEKQLESVENQSSILNFLKKSDNTLPSKKEKVRENVQQSENKKEKNEVKKEEKEKDDTIVVVYE